MTWLNEEKLSVTNGDNIVAGWYKCQTGETKSAFRSTRAPWQAMLVQMLWGFQFVECLKQFERKISFSMLSNILKIKKNVMENKNLDQMQSCKRQQRQVEYRYELFKD